MKMLLHTSGYVFSVDLFSHAIPQWTIHLKHLDGTPCQCIEIGSHEGRSAMWIADNLLSHPDSRLYCIDSWVATWSEDLPAAPVSPPGHITELSAAEVRFDANVMACHRGKQINKIKSSSAMGLLSLNYRKQVESSDFIYIDGWHEAKNVMEDFVLAWPLLKPSGILIFDDYPWTHPCRYRCPGPAINSILDLWAMEMDVLHKDHQVIIKKK